MDLLNAVSVASAVPAFRKLTWFFELPILACTTIDNMGNLVGDVKPDIRTGGDI